jgi:hypothetical protein
MKSPICLNNKCEGSSKWVVHKAQYLLIFLKWDSNLSGLDCGEKSIIITVEPKASCVG